MWHKAFTLSSLLLCAVSPSYAQTPTSNIGLAPYAMLSDHWDCNAMGGAYNALPEWRISVLWNTFGKNTSCYNRVLQDSRLRLVEVHLVNEVCARNHRCGNYEFMSGLSPQDYERRLLAHDPALILKLQQYTAEAYNDLIRPLPANVACFVDVGLESNLSQQAGAVAISAVRGIIEPRCRMVWSPVSGRGQPGITFEQHGSGPQLSAPCIYNNDGTGLSGASGATTLASYRQCAASFLWTPGDNCNNGISGFQDPRSRKGCSKSSDFQSAVSIVQAANRLVTQPPPPAPTEADFQGCTVRYPAHDGDKVDFLYKQSEAYPNAVVFLPKQFANTNSISLVSAGAVIETRSRSGLYTEDHSSRPFFRLAHPATSYKPFVVHAGPNCWAINDPLERTD